MHVQLPPSLRRQLFSCSPISVFPRSNAIKCNIHPVRHAVPDIAGAVLLVRVQLPNPDAEWDDDNGIV